MATWGPRLLGRLPRSQGARLQGQGVPVPVVNLSVASPVGKGSKMAVRNKEESGVD